MWTELVTSSTIFYFSKPFKYVTIQTIKKKISFSYFHILIKLQTPVCTHTDEVQSKLHFEEYRNRYTRKKKSSKGSAYKTPSIPTNNVKPSLSTTQSSFSANLFVSVRQSNRGKMGWVGGERRYKFSLLKTPWTWKDKPQTLGLQWLGIQANSTTSFKAFSILKWLRMELTHGVLVNPYREAHLWYMQDLHEAHHLQESLELKEYCEGFGFVFIL